MTADLGYYEFDAQTDNIGRKNLGKHGPQSVEEEMEQAVVGVADGYRMLKPHVPHAEEATGKQGYHHHYHGALRVVGIVDVHTRARRLIRGEKKSVEAVENGMQAGEFPALLELRLDTVDFFL